MNVNENNSTIENRNNSTRVIELKPFDIESKVADYANIRVTDIPTVQRLYPPKPATIRKEVIMQNVKDKMLNKIREYKEQYCNDKGHIKKSNIDKIECKGLKEVTERVNQKDIIVFSTDKTG